MRDTNFTRRQFLKGTGALVVSFNLFPPASSLFAQTADKAGGEPDPTQLDSWLAVGKDCTVTVFSGKADLGTGVETALAQIVAEELDVPSTRTEMASLDTSQVIDHALTASSSTVAGRR